MEIDVHCSSTPPRASAPDQRAEEPTALLERARLVMDHNWDAEHGYTRPNAATYPWMWLWDSCFHAVIYCALGDERALIEATSVFRWQTEDGMVPHMGYQQNEAYGRRSWHSSGGSTITQPPLYGHMLRVLSESGFDVSPLVDHATAGLQFLFEHRVLPNGLIGIVHPWEAGTDDSPRWDPWLTGSRGRSSWSTVKSRLVTSLEVSRHGSTLSNPLFSVAPASFNALVAFNGLELAAVTGDEDLRGACLELAEVLDSTFDDELCTWKDVAADGSTTSEVRTIESLLAALVSPKPDRVRRALVAAIDPDGFGLPFGPSGVDPREPCFEPSTYWRGTAWPPLTYLLHLAARRSGHTDVMLDLDERARRSASQSGFAEYVNPLTGAGLGAVPQSWACLPVVSAVWEAAPLG